VARNRGGRRALGIIGTIFCHDVFGFLACCSLLGLDVVDT
jgi:hypothetical protein